MQREKQSNRKIVDIKKEIKKERKKERYKERKKERKKGRKEERKKERKKEKWINVLQRKDRAMKRKHQAKSKQ